MYNLLIVEDEEEVREGIKNWLLSQTACYQLFTAKNGAKALETIENVKIDFVLLDMSMPVMDGMAFLKELKKRGCLGISIVILSGYGEFEYARAALEYGVLQYILKPVTPDAILQVANDVKELLDQKAVSEQEARFLREYLKKHLQKGNDLDILGKIPRLSIDVSEFMMGIRMGLSEEVKRRIRDFFWRYRQKPCADKDQIFAFVSLVCAAIVLACNEAGIPALDLIADYPSALLSSGRGDDDVQTESWLLEVVDRVIPLIGVSKKNRVKGIVEQAKKIIDDGYRDDISTAYLSEKLFLNKDYIGKLFKDVTGFSVNDYLNRIRVERAMELLKEGRLKVYEVAQQVGYKDEHYFSTTFKKITGASPSRI